jgi:hypothetical protein
MSLFAGIISLCNLCDLCVSVVSSYETMHRRDTEITEVAQRLSVNRSGDNYRGAEDDRGDDDRERNVVILFDLLAH